MEIFFFIFLLKFFLIVNSTNLRFSSINKKSEFPAYCLSSTTGYSSQFSGPLQNDDKAFEEWLELAQKWKKDLFLIYPYSNKLFDDPKFAFSKTNFISPQIQATDLFLYDRKAKKYTVDKFLTDINDRYGKIDSILFWPAYPNIGIDSRNQFEWLESVPGGLEGIKFLVKEFKERDIRFYLPYNPWDTGTNRPTIENNSNDNNTILPIDYLVLRDILIKTGADGIFGDTMLDMNGTFFNLTNTILEPEGGGSLLTMNWTISAWGEDWSMENSPCVSEFKWLEPRRMCHQVHRWYKDKTNDIHFSLFNGVGYVSWENIFGIWNGMTELGSYQVRIAGVLMRYFADFLQSQEWLPYYPTKIYNIFASVWRNDGSTLIFLINRSGQDLNNSEPIIDINQLYKNNFNENLTIFDCYHGNVLKKSSINGSIINLSVEALGLGCIFIFSDKNKYPSESFIREMKNLTSLPLKSLDNNWEFLPQQMIKEPNTLIPSSIPEGMVEIPEGVYFFNSTGVEIEGPIDSGVDVQFPWDDHPKQNHTQTLNMPPYYIDKYPVTNIQWQQYLNESGYLPDDPFNYLKFWDQSKKSFSNNISLSPVTWISPSEAQSYCRFYKKRLPHVYEWQYAAQGLTNFSYPWGNEEPSFNNYSNNSFIPQLIRERSLPPPSPIGKHPKGDSVFGVSDMVGSIWQWTDTFEDIHQATNVIKGGSFYYPEGSGWYFPHAIRVDQHNRYLMMDERYERAGTVGFRCVVDATTNQVTIAEKNSYNLEMQ